MQSIKSSSIARREFVKGAALGMAAMGVAAGTGVALADEAPFDASYDVVVVGYGAAGGTSAFYAAKNGAKVLLVDVAPAGHEGGNSRFCGQLSMYTDDLDGLKTYLEALDWQFDNSEDVHDAYAQGITHTPEIMRDFGVEEPYIWGDHIGIDEPQEPIASMTLADVWRGNAPEFPELPGGDAVNMVTVHPGFFDGQLYATIQAAIEAQDNIDVWLESPARHLIQDPETKAIIGAVIEHEGAEVRVGAASGVVLACGGFECNKTMIQDYLGVARAAYNGGAYNMGDGIKMAQEVGADLWHMHNYNSGGLLAGMTFEVPEGERSLLWNNFTPCTRGGMLLVGEDGSRFYNECGVNRHGRVNFHGVWRTITGMSHRSHIIFDEAQKAIIDEADVLGDFADSMVSASSAEELAELIGADPAILAQTIEDFNSFAENGRDIQFGRNPETMRALEGETLYAMPMQPTVLNTQGGPRRNGKAQVLNPAGDPIPGLFAAGELGGEYAWMYQGTGDIAGCLVFGKIAGTNAALGVA